MIGDIPRQVPQVLRNLLADARFEVRPWYSGEGFLVALLIDGVCPACAYAASIYEIPAPRNTAHIAVRSRRLKCENDWCPAGARYTGTDDDSGRPNGLHIEQWSTFCEPEPPRENVARRPTVSLRDADGGAVKAIIAQALDAATPGVVAVGNIAPPGAGKTRAVGSCLADGDGGLFLLPSHALADEHGRAYRERTGRRYRRMSGLIRRLSEHEQRIAADWQEWGWSAVELARRAGRRLRHGRGEADELVVGVHEHLPVLAELAAETDFQMPATVVMDELPPLLDVRRVPVEHFAFVAGPHVRHDIEVWSEHRAALARHVVSMGKVLLDERRTLTREQARHPTYTSGPALLKLFALSGRQPFERPIRAISAYQATLAANRWTNPCPLPPAHDAFDGRITRREWPRGDFDDIAAALLDELADPLREHPRTTGLCMVASGYGDHATVDVEFRQAWGARVPSTYGVMIADATADYLAPALRAAWPNHSVRLLPLIVEPHDPAATKRIWISSSSYTRRTMLTPSRTVRARSFPALVRLLRVVVDEVVHELGRSRAVGVIAPKPVANVLMRAHALALAAPSSGAEDVSLTPAQRRMDRLAAVFRDALTSRKVSHFGFGWQGNVRGTNEYETCDALVTFSYTPNLGAVAEDARVLGIDAKEYENGLRSAELEQEWGRLRAVRASTSKLLLHVSRDRPDQWPLARAISLPLGGRIPSENVCEAQRLASDLAVAAGSVSPAFIRWIASHPREFGVAFPDARAEMVVRSAAAARLAPRVLSRAVAAATPNATTVAVRAPHGPAWRMRETRPGAARDLAARIHGASSRREQSNG